MKPPAGGRGENYEFIVCKKRLQDHALLELASIAHHIGTELRVERYNSRVLFITALNVPFLTQRIKFP